MRVQYRDHDPRQCRRRDARALPYGGVEGDGAHHDLALYQVRVERLPRRLVERVHAAHHEAYRDQVPRLDQLEQGYDGQQKYERGVRGLGDYYHRPLVHPVGVHSPEEVQQNGGRRTGDPHRAEECGRAGELVCQPALREHEHLEAGNGRERAEPESAVHGIPQRRWKREAGPAGALFDVEVLVQSRSSRQATWAYSTGSPPARRIASARRGGRAGIARLRGQAEPDD